MNLLFARVLWFNTDKGMGVAGLQKNGSTVGFIRDRGRCFYQGTEHLELRMSGRRLTTYPVEGDTICLELAPYRSRKGHPYAEIWSTAHEYDSAGQQVYERHVRLKKVLDDPAAAVTLMHQAQREAEWIRLRCNPKFRLIEQQHLFGNPNGDKKVRFAGTQSELRDVVNPPSFSNRQPLITVTGKVFDGYQYVRWFEREIVDGWRRCEDPLKLSLPEMILPDWSLEETALLLKDAKIERAPWRMTGIGFQWWLNNKVVAQGNCVEVTVLKADYHAETRFTEGDAEYLWEHSDRSSLRDIPDARNYRPSRRGDQKTAFDLSQLGRSASEWENIR